MESMCLMLKKVWECVTNWCRYIYCYTYWIYCKAETIQVDGVLVVKLATICLTLLTSVYLAESRTQLAMVHAVSDTDDFKNQVTSGKL